MELVFFGASDLTRTGDLLITSEMHYRLCYTSLFESLIIISIFQHLVNFFFCSLVFSFWTHYACNQMCGVV